MHKPGGSVDISLAWFGSTSHLERRVIANQHKILSDLTDHFYPMVKHFYPDRSVRFPGDPTHIHTTQRLIKWFDEDDSDVNHVLWHVHSPDLSPLEHLWQIFGSLCLTVLSSTIVKTPIEGISFGRMVFILPAQFHRLVELMPKSTEVVPVACSGPKPH